MGMDKDKLISNMGTFMKNEIYDYLENNKKKIEKIYLLNKEINDLNDYKSFAENKIKELENDDKKLENINTINILNEKLNNLNNYKNFAENKIVELENDLEIMNDEF